MIEDLKAIAIQFSMDIDLGIIDLSTALEEIRKDSKTWIPLLKIMENCCELTKNALDRLYLESLYQKN